MNKFNIVIEDVNSQVLELWLSQVFKCINSRFFLPARLNDAAGVTEIIELYFTISDIIDVFVLLFTLIILSNFQGQKQFSNWNFACTIGV